MPKRNAQFKRRQRLGQFWTQAELAELIARQLPADTRFVADLAAGDGALLEAVRARSPQARLLGLDIDMAAVEAARERAPGVRFLQADGLSHNLVIPRVKSAIIANPPFSETPISLDHRALLDAGLPAAPSNYGPKRLDLLFLSKYLQWARKAGARISILMPCGFADGDMYARYRASLLENYGLIRAIEIPAGLFTSTEARSVLLVIDGAKTRSRRVQIGRYLPSGVVELIYEGPIVPGERIDARYHAGKRLIDDRVPTLGDIGVEIDRGTFSASEARRREVRAVHTSHLALAKRGCMRLVEEPIPFDGVGAKVGDILLPRTGTRVVWRPAMVTSGAAPITDHVFRIRAPQNVRQVVHGSFRSELFPQWLESVSKGVCATVLTKRELLEMPAFALA